MSILLAFFTPYCKIIPHFVCQLADKFLIQRAFREFEELCLVSNPNRDGGFNIFSLIINIPGSGISFVYLPSPA
jgi:hypothetical protein